MPRDVAVARACKKDVVVAAQIDSLGGGVERSYTTAHTRLPRTHLLSNGRYSTMVTGNGNLDTAGGRISRSHAGAKT